MRLSLFFVYNITYTRQPPITSVDCGLILTMGIASNYSGDHTALEYIAVHSIVLQCTVYSIEPNTQEVPRLMDLVQLSVVSFRKGC